MLRASTRFLKPSFLFSSYAVFLYGLIVFYVFRWPIVTGDTDLWYHLNAGRYLVEHRALPFQSFFSFIVPPRVWVDYYWLFQLLVFVVYSASGYLGLLWLRHALYVATISVILWVLLATRRRLYPNVSRLYLAIVWVLYVLLLLPRSQLVRPHLFTYLFIVVFIALCERRSRSMIYLPLLAVLWCNLHGGAFPVMMLIVLAYLLEYFLDRLLSPSSSRIPAISFLVPAALSLWAVLATPHGVKLLTVPFTTTAWASRYISEFHPLTLDDLTGVHMASGIPAPSTVFNVVFVLAWVGLIISGFKKQLRISHLVLLIGGTALLLKGVRFTYECALLALPVIAATAPMHSPTTARRTLKPHAIASGVLLLLVPFLSFRALFSIHPRFPFSRRSLPHGVTLFLQQAHAGGSLLNHPNTGGYLQWMLYPRYRILMDMEVPFLFTDEDMFMATHIFTDKEVLARALTTAQPSFITVPIKIGPFRDLIQSFPEYVPVFFDDAEVLYVSKEQFPSIAEPYQLKALDPFQIYPSGIAALLERSDRVAFMREIHRILTIDPSGLIANHIASVVYADDKAYDRALEHAQTIVEDFPEAVTGYGLKGDALQGLQHFDQAIVEYKRALRRATAGQRPELYSQLGLAYSSLNRYQQAYACFKKAANPFSPTATYRELMTLGKAAFFAGKPREAMLLLRLAASTVPAEEVKWRTRLTDILNVWQAAQNAR